MTTPTITYCGVRFPAIELSFSRGVFSPAQTWLFLLGRAVQLLVRSMGKFSFTGLCHARDNEGGVCMPRTHVLITSVRSSSLANRVMELNERDIVILLEEKRFMDLHHTCVGRRYSATVGLKA
jgi:hypothetical protein